MQYPFIKSPSFLYGSGFFLKIIYYCTFIIFKMIFLMEFHPKILIFNMVLDLIDGYQYHTP